MKASNQVKEFKYRIVNGDVFEFESLDINFNLLAGNNCFVSKRVSHDLDEGSFNKKVQSIKSNTPNKGELNIDPSEDMGLVITSYLPWMDIQSINEPIFNKDESFIKIVYGRYEKVGDKFYLSMSVRAHHGLVDGVHIGQFFDLLEKSIKEIQ
jgi:chloramphenicol O-acetyltransferase type A